MISKISPTKYLFYQAILFYKFFFFLSSTPKYFITHGIACNLKIKEFAKGNFGGAFYPLLGGVSS
jgi:hypothetical protein